MSVTLECLQDFKENEWIAISKQSESKDEFLTATYTKALKEHFDSYRPRRMPLASREWESDYSDYISLSKDKKSEAWRVIQENHKGYLRNLQTAVEESVSDFKFLQEMRDYFKEKGMNHYVSHIEQRLFEFLEFFKSDCYAFKSIVPVAI